MPRGSDGPRRDATLAEILGNESAGHLRSLLDCLPRERPRPTRKAEMAAAIERRLAGELLNKLWDRLNRYQRHAVGEVLYRTDGAFHPNRFRAKYGALPAGATCGTLTLATMSCSPAVGIARRHARLWRLTCRRYWTLGGTHEARRHHGDRVPQLEEW